MIKTDSYFMAVTSVQFSVEMFIKKELSDEELNQKRQDLNFSLQRAQDARNKILEERIQKLRKHSLKVTELKNKAKTSPQNSFHREHQIIDFLLQIKDTSDFETFQEFMTKSESVSRAGDVVLRLEKNCEKDLYESIKNRPKVFMSLIMIAKYPEEVMPNANDEEQNVIIKAKEFYDMVDTYFKEPSESSNEKQKEISSLWIQAIHAFDEWLVKDKLILFEKMKTEFLTWTKTIGNMPVGDASRTEWEPHAVKYQNEILKRIYDTFGIEYIKILFGEVEVINQSFTDSELVLLSLESSQLFTCEWNQKAEIHNSPENTQNDEKTLTHLETTNIRILHELMIKEEDFNFDSILSLSGKSLKEISESNKKNLGKLISMFEKDSDSKLIAETLHELFLFICSSLYELAGDNDDYCQEIKLVDCTINAVDWFKDVVALLQWSLNMCKKCCAPARDGLCKKIEANLFKLIQTKDNSEMNEFLTDIFSELLDLLNYMRSDFCNFRMRYLVNKIGDKGIIEQYEMEELKKNFQNFEKTKKWLEIDNPDGYKAVEILANSFLKFFDPINNDILLDSKVPETFYLDIDRIKRYKEEFILFLKKEAALIYLKNHLRFLGVESGKNDLKLKTVISSIEPSKDSKHIENIFKEALSEYSDMEILVYKGNISRLFGFCTDDKVFALLKNREISKIRTLLINDRSTVSKDTLTGKICSLFRYNKNCFGSIYDKLLLKDHENNNQ